MKQRSASPRVPGRDVQELRARLVRGIGDEHRIVSTTSVLDEHGADFSLHQPRRPDVVVYAQSTEDVAAVLEVADRLRVPVVPFGRGTSLEGHTIPANGGVSLDLSRMSKVLAVDDENMLAVVQPGTTRTGLDDRVRNEGLMFPVDPGADATLGGMAATNASGTTTVKYGSMRRQVLALEVVLPGGRVMRVGSRVRKSSAGYDLAALFVGSEGTLGVITELTLRLHPTPEQVVAGRMTFADVVTACQASVLLVRLSTTVTRMELLDEWTLGAINRYQGSSYPEEPTLFLEISGTDAAVTDELSLLEEVARGQGATSMTFERSAEGRAQLWRARHEKAYAVMATGPGKRSVSTDVCVPISYLGEAITLARRKVEELGLQAGIAGHVGDGNYHVSFMVDPTDEDEVRRARVLSDALVEHALGCGGTCTGEHGVGAGKIGYLENEHASALPLMQAIKDVFDPNGIMNPGKVLRGAEA